MRLLISAFAGIGLIVILHLTVSSVLFSPKDAAEAGFPIYYLFAGLALMGFVSSKLEDIPFSKKDKFIRATLMNLEVLGFQRVKKLSSALKSISEGDVKQKLFKEFDSVDLRDSRQIVDDFRSKKSPESSAFMIYATHCTLLSENEPDLAREAIASALRTVLSWRSDRDFDASEVVTYALACEEHLLGKSVGQ